MLKPRRPIQVVSTRDVNELYQDPKTQKFLKDQIGIARELMEQDENVGNYIKKKPWPDRYVKTHDVSNLYQYRLGDYYRMIYTVRGTEKVKYYQILDILTHPEYERIFGYK
jgi:mRNA-degrading endonuclease RelE of RelBE toxin-antitoxin system